VPLGNLEVLPRLVCAVSRLLFPCLCNPPLSFRFILRCFGFLSLSIGLAALSVRLPT
jgi:hypothetical protein